MISYKIHRNNIDSKGYSIINNIFDQTQLDAIVDIIEKTDTGRPSFRKTNDLFAIRQFLKEIPEIRSLIFTAKLNELISRIFGDDYFAVKSIYFDKPDDSNWFVAYHQDLTISVDRKIQLSDFGPWTVKYQQFAVQPPINILQNNFTIRIHLDDTDEQNGALKVIPGSQLKGVYRPETVNWGEEREHICAVEKGGVMIMRPLLLHASDRTVNNKKRRVIHIEFSNIQLPAGLNWSEKE
ncbi:phytanoyl-CoA dioxygenase [Mucilaginibacter sp. PPCGB 2223]|uniref:phytanoyl-CoA dioxygenase family protein n=1 Tax=Mucilaginibacter sp. PPCGB 2223 TaxID=1886027 RepID=UPI000826B37D|nr:phytanoyl-CoA dioxygenase family protein [Mucilaginibacter sp. PPCGB 2223]OCX53690.1 phytanoyl-CoA dioxygenase [Mucilaginibacter sp. PPCGB 2223]